MDTTTSVKGFQQLKNQILGRLSQCTDSDQLAKQLKQEADTLHKPKELDWGDHMNKAMLIGEDITEGIDRANAVIDGKLDDL